VGEDLTLTVEDVGVEAGRAADVAQDGSEAVVGAQEAVVQGGGPWVGMVSAKVASLAAEVEFAARSAAADSTAMAWRERMKSDELRPAFSMSSWR